MVATLFNLINLTFSIYFFLFFQKWCRPWRKHAYSKKSTSNSFKTTSFPHSLFWHLDLFFFYHFRMPHILSRPTLTQAPNYVNLAQKSNIKFIDVVKISLSFFFHVTALIAAKRHFFDEHYHPLSFSLFILLGFKMVLVIHRFKRKAEVFDRLG